MLGRLSWREGSGFDKIFEVLLSPGPQAPELIETHDRVQVTLCRRILKPEVIDCIAKANQTCQLIQRERIGLGIPRSRIRRSIEQLVKAGKLVAKGVKSGTRYSLPSFGSKPGLSAIKTVELTHDAKRERINIFDAGAPPTTLLRVQKKS